jgi:tellurite resistance protein
MTILTEGAGRVIAGDITAAFDATDTALLTGARVTTSVLEGTADSGLHPRTKQKLLESLNQGFGKMLEGRKEMVQAHSQMIVIQRQSNLRTVDFGCWGAPETFFTTAKASSVQSAPADA